MSIYYRVVLTCWDPDIPRPYEDDLSGVDLSIFHTKEEAQEAIEGCVADEVFSLNDLDTATPRGREPVEDSDGNIIGYDYPFRGDTDGEHAGVTRFWDGDDYRNVTAYDIYELSCDSPELSQSSYYKYRGFWILPNASHTSFSVEQFDTTLFRHNSLKEALRAVDSLLVALQYSEPAKATLDKPQQEAAAGRYAVFVQREGVIFVDAASEEQAARLAEYSGDDEISWNEWFTVENVQLEEKLIENKAIQSATFVSVWDGGSQIETPCKVNCETGEIFDIHISEGTADLVNQLDKQYIRLSDGTEHSVTERESAGCFWYQPEPAGGEPFSDKLASAIDRAASSEVSTPTKTKTPEL